MRACTATHVKTHGCRLGDVHWKYTVKTPETIVMFQTPYVTHTKETGTEGRLGCKYEWRHCILT